MRRFLFAFAAFLSLSSGAYAQSLDNDLPPPVIIQGVSAPESAAAPPPVAQPEKDPYTVTDIAGDVTADQADHARDQALTQAERAAFLQLCARFALSGPATTKLTDDDIAGLVQSFDLQNERVSATHYAGVFTIHFKPDLVRAKIAKLSPTPPASKNGDKNGAEKTLTLPQSLPKPIAKGPSARLVARVQSPNLAAWLRIQKQLETIPQVSTVKVIDVMHNGGQIELTYTGTAETLQQGAAEQGLNLLHLGSNQWLLADVQALSAPR